MVQVPPKAGAASVEEGGSGHPNTYAPVPWVIGGPDGPSPTGIALRLDWASDAFRLVLLSGADALMSLGSYSEEDVVAEWRALSAATGLPLQVQLPNGAVMTPYPQIGRLQVGPVRMRRRHGLLNHRRPRFLARRKTGRMSSCPQIYREPELARGERG